MELPRPVSPGQREVSALFPGSRNGDHEVKLPGPQGPDEYFPVMTVTIPHLHQDSLVSAPQNHVTSTPPLSWRHGLTPARPSRPEVTSRSTGSIQDQGPNNPHQQRERILTLNLTPTALLLPGPPISPLAFGGGYSSSPTPQPPGAGVTAASREAHSPVVRFRQPAASLGRCSTRTMKEEGRDAWPPPPPPHLCPTLAADRLPSQLSSPLSQPDAADWCAGRTREGFTHFLFLGVTRDRAHEAAGQTLSSRPLCLSNLGDCLSTRLESGQEKGPTASLELGQGPASLSRWAHPRP